MNARAYPVLPADTRDHGTAANGGAAVSRFLGRVGFRLARAPQVLVSARRLKPSDDNELLSP
jgi:hypothetical protein